MFTELKLVLWKNLIIRSRHWLLTITETVVPILLFCLVAYGRSQITGLNKVEINETTISEPFSVDQLMTHFSVGEVKVLYAPYSSFTESIMKRVQLKFQMQTNDIREFPNEDLLMDYYIRNSNHSTAAIIFRGDSDKVLDYDIRMYEKYVSWDTERLYSIFDDERGVGSAKYIYQGFLALQLAVDFAFIEVNNVELSNVTLEAQEFPYPPHRQDSGLNDIFLNFLPLITIFSFMFLCPMVLKRVVEEKFTGIKELMKMVGMKSWMLWLGWYLHALTSNLISIAFIVFVMKASLWGVPYPPIEYCNWQILFTFLLLYCLAAITFCFLIATLFNRPSIAMVIGIFAWILSYMIPRAIVSCYETLTWRHKILFGLFPNMALHYGYSAISVYETREIGVHWSNLFQPGSDGTDDITMGNVFMVLIVDIVLFMLLTIYIDNIRPGQYGIPKPVLFPLLGVKKLVQNVLRKGSAQVETETVLLRNVEEGFGRKPCIQIKNLRKTYGPIVAVDGLNLDIYKDQITVLLGHNGAGKTTTMSIITGMISSTSGSIEINGINIKDNANDARKNIGLCPQHNLLFTDLTTMQHLQFFSMLKGKSCSEAAIEASDMLEKLGIYEKRNEMACALSGGMKRRLCLGMALMGNSSVLILDEPTSGMDPENRRKIWNMLQEYRKSKTILITTHFMEEADVLGDWIAIMANGRLQCYGTSLFLKEKYATGYHLSLILKSRNYIEHVDRVIKEQISEARLIRENEENVVYMLPLNSKQLYANLFERLNAEKDKIANLSLSITTLEDVFLKVKDESKGKKENNVEDQDCVDGNATSRNAMTPKTQNIWHYIYALILKRWFFAKKKFLWYIPGVLVMISSLLITIYLGQSSSDFEGSGGPSLNLTLNAYGKTGVYFSAQQNGFLEKMKLIYGQLVADQGSDPFYVQQAEKSIVDKGVENIAYYKQHMIAAADFSASKDQVFVKAFYSPRALHGAAISINLAMNVIVKSLLGDEYSIKTRNVPLQSINTETSPAEQSEVEVVMWWLILVPIGLLFMMGNFIIFPHYELSTNFVQIQFLSGIKPFWYWLFNFLFDYLLIYSLEVIIILVTLAVSNTFYSTNIFGVAEYAALIAIFFSYAFSAIPCTYLFSYKKSVAGGFAALLMLGMFAGIVLTTIIIVLEMYEDQFIIAGSTLKHIFICLCPQFGLSYVSVKFARKYVENYNWIHMPTQKRNHICKMEEHKTNPCCFGPSNGESEAECRTYQSYFRNEDLGISIDLLEMLVSFILYFLILYVCHTMWFKKVTEMWDRKSDFVKMMVRKCQNPKGNLNSRIVDNEHNNSSSNKDDECCLITKNLKKSYGEKQAVNGVNLGLKKSECFGLLGVNGAGKTTLFRMLASDIPKDDGIITLYDDKNVAIDDYEYSKQIGYCPQNDALNYAMTGRELLIVMAMLRGFTKQEAEIVTNLFIEAFDLAPYADKPCLDYSGGNKRKLNLCLSFMGYPQIILLDEPTSGVDPASRRQFWSALTTIKKEQKATFVLCSHSMEECEVLCNRIAIMKDGTIKNKNIGTLAELKQTYQKGYTVVFKLKQGTNNGVESVDGPSTSVAQESPENQLDNAFKHTFKDSEVTDKHSGSIFYHVKDPNQRLSNLFAEVEALKAKYDFIDDYAISGTSLEDVFLKIAENRTEDLK